MVWRRKGRQSHRDGEPKGGCGGRGGRRRPSCPPVGSSQLPSQHRLHHPPLRLPLDTIQEEAEKAKAQGLPTGPLFQGSLQWHRRGAFPDVDFLFCQKI